MAEDGQQQFADKVRGLKINSPFIDRFPLKVWELRKTFKKPIHDGVYLCRSAKGSGKVRVMFHATSLVAKKIHRTDLPNHMVKFQLSLDELQSYIGDCTKEYFYAWKLDNIRELEPHVTGVQH